MSSLRILIISQDSHGLSHTLRALSVAERIAGSFRNASIMLLTDLAIIGKFKLPGQVDYVHLPGIIYSGFDEVRSRNLNLKAKKIIQIRCKIAQSAAKTFKPQLVVVDRNPLNLPIEMKKILGYIRDILPQTRIVWTLPDVQGDPELITRAWHQKKIYKLLQQNTDEIWIYGAKELFHQGKVYQFPSSLKKRVVYTGYLNLCQGGSDKSIEDALFANRERPFVLLTAGSGNEAFALLDAYLSFLEEHAENPPVRSVIITGPMMPSQDKRFFMQRAQQLPQVVFHRFNKHLQQYIKHADLVVCTGGYNTVCDILNLGKRAILAPGEMPPKEHYWRAKLFDKLKVAEMITPAMMSKGYLGEKILSAMQQNTNSLDGRKQNGLNIPLTGMDRIVERVAHLTQTEVTESKKVTD